MIGIELTIVLIAIVVNIATGIVIVNNNSKSATNILLLFLSIAIGLYLGSDYLSKNSSANLAVLFWSRNLLAIQSLISTLFLLLSATFPKNKLNISPIYTITITVITSIIIIMSQTPLVISNIDPINNIVIQGPLFSIFYSLISISLLTIFIILIIKYKQYTGLQRSQIKYFLTGFITMITLIVTTKLFSILFNFPELAKITPLFTIVFVAFTGYSIIKQRLLDINSFITKSITYTIMLIFIAFFYTSYLFIINALITGNRLNTFDLATSTILSLMIIVSFQPLKSFVEKSFAPIFSKSIYNSNEFLERLSKIMAANLRLEDITDELTTELNKTLQLEKSYITIFSNTEVNVSHYSKNINLPEASMDIFKSYIRRHKNKTILFDELEESRLKRHLRKNRIGLISSLEIRNKKIGLLILGSKKSGDLYTSQDTRNIKIILPEIAVAIDNALSYEKIKHFNIDLKKKIDAATTKLENANKELKQLDDLKDEFISIVSHELRTPMTAIKSYLWLVLNESKSISKKDKDQLQVAYNSTERLISLVNDMLVISKIENSQTELEMKAFNLKDVISQVIEELIVYAGEKKLMLELITSAGDVKIMGDEAKLREVIFNLIGNAIKFTQEGGCIKVYLDRIKDNVILNVSDNGPGIPKNDIKHLFQKFSKIMYSYKNISKVKGSGLGLYISQKIIDLHHGEISVESKLGKGTSFIVTLPALKE